MRSNNYFSAFYFNFINNLTVSGNFTDGSVLLVFFFRFSRCLSNFLEAAKIWKFDYVHFNQKYLFLYKLSVYSVKNVLISTEAMFLRNVADQQDAPEQDQQHDENMSKSLNLEQNIVFPYFGPPGSGPGLLGSKPGAGKLEYLIALEHYAASLKSALIIAETLKNGKNKDLDIDMVYDSICAIENELQNQNGARFSQG